MKHRTNLLLGLLCAVIAYCVFDRLNRPLPADVLGVLEGENAQKSMVLLSESYRIDRIFMSMQGPYSHQSDLSLTRTAELPELLWVTGVGTEVVGRNGRKKLPDDFFCHANLSLDPKCSSPEKHNELLNTSLDWRLFTLVPGKMHIQLPDGFGIPVLSYEKLDLLSMSLNQNLENPNFQLRFKSYINFIRQNEVQRSLKPLFMRGLYAVVPITGHSGDSDSVAPDAICAVPGMSASEPSSPGMACAPQSMTASRGGASGDNTLHWMIPPGRHTYVSDVTEQLKLNFETTIHYGTAHLHPMGESIALRNRTTGKTVLKFHSKDYTDRKGVAYMEEISIPEGLALNQKHEYELVTIYNNTSGEMTDVMGIVYLYLLDKEFKYGSVGDERTTTLNESKGTASQG